MAQALDENDDPNETAMAGISSTPHLVQMEPRVRDAPAFRALRTNSSFLGKNPTS